MQTNTKISYTECVFDRNLLPVTKQQTRSNIKCNVVEHKNLYTWFNPNYPSLRSNDIIKYYYGYDFKQGITQGAMINRNYVVLNVTDMGGCKVAVVCKNKKVYNDIDLEDDLNDNDIKYLIENHYLDEAWYNIPKGRRAGRRKRF